MDVNHASAERVIRLMGDHPHAGLSTGNPPRQPLAPLWVALVRIEVPMAFPLNCVHTPPPWSVSPDQIQQGNNGSGIRNEVYEEAGYHMI